jgi:hypothetical protein
MCCKWKRQTPKDWREWPLLFFHAADQQESRHANEATA